jgi:ribokinase
MGDLTHLAPPRITVVGSYATGLTMKVNRLPARGETLLGTGYRVDFGGKGSNQAIGCARLGADVTFISKIGTDTFGDMACNLYLDEGIDVAKLYRTNQAATGVGFILVESATGQNCIVLDPGANEFLTAEDILTQDQANDGSVLLTQLEIPVAAAEAALTRGRRAGATTILNPAPVRPLPPAVLQLVDILTPNASEAKVLAGRRPDDQIAPETVARELIAKGVKQVVMTLGEEGALMVAGATAKHIEAIAVNAVDTTGAGDAFNAGFAVALASGAGVEDAVKFAVITGGLAVTKEGVVPALPNRQDILSFYESRHLPPPHWFAGAQARMARRGISDD